MLHVKRLHPDAKLPTVAHPGEDLGYDVYALEGAMLPAGKQVKVHTGIVAYEKKESFTDLMNGSTKYGLLLRDRSSMAAKGITLSGGVVDAGYRGELAVILTSHEYAAYIEPGQKIAQMIPIPVLTDVVIEVEELPESSRGDRGFGSSGQ
jgi:dUTP pyrophosphatase